MAAKRINEETQEAVKQALAELFTKPDKSDQADLIAQKQLRSEQSRQAKEPHFWIEIIKLQDDKEGAVYVGAAGVSYLVPKGVRVPVPVSVVNCLNLAQVESWVPHPEPQYPGHTKLIRYKRYNFSEFGPASAEDVKKYRAEQKKREAGQIIPEQVPEEEVGGAPQIEYGDAKMTSVGE